MKDLAVPTAQDGGPLSRIESFQYPAAHVGHLTLSQTNALDSFKKLCQQQGYWKPADGKEPATHDDETLLRYLRARKFVPQDAFQQFKDTEDWRKENQLDTLYETIDVQEYEETRRLYPQWTGRRDKRGIPLYVYEVSHIDSKAVNAYQTATSSRHQSVTTKVPIKMMRLFALYENLCRFVLPLCSAVPDRPFGETPISQSNNIVDISKVGLKQFWNLKSHMQDASQLATAHYPETLDRIFIIGAPSFFPTVWGWIKRWFDPITVSKIFILSSANMKSTLEQYIDSENIPKKYGGKLDFKFGDLPILEPEIENALSWDSSTIAKSKDGHRTIPTGPIKWQYDKKGDLVAVAVGTEAGKPRNKVIAGLHPKTPDSVGALSPGRAERRKIFRTTTGEATHPPTPPPEITDTGPAPGSETPERKASVDAAAFVTPEKRGSVDVAPVEKAMADADLNDGKSVDARVPESSRQGTFTVPYKDHDQDVASPPPGARQGTSSTRFAQQEGTHAEQQLATGTPEVKVDSQGERQGVMEPSTVGQAPKEHPLPEPEEPQPTYMEQAKDMAASAAVTAANYVPASIANAVGLTQKKDEIVEERAPPQDERMDEMKGQNVEEFLRSKTMSNPQGETNFAKKTGS